MGGGEGEVGGDGEGRLLEDDHDSAVIPEAGLGGGDKVVDLGQRVAGLDLRTARHREGCHSLFGECIFGIVRQGVSCRNFWFKNVRYLFKSGVSILTVTSVDFVLQCDNSPFIWRRWCC